MEVTSELLAAVERPRNGIVAYDRRNLAYGMQENGEQGLLMQVVFNGQPFSLDVREVDTGVHIAFLNEDPKTGHEKLAIATGVEKARLIVDLHKRTIAMGKPNGVEAIFTIESTKSTPSAWLSAELFSQYIDRHVPFEVLEAKTDQEAVIARSVIEPVSYLPITAQKEKKYKFLGVSLYQAELMWDIYCRGKGIFIFVDDAFTTGASAGAADKAAKKVTVNKHFRMKKVVDIREQSLVYPYLAGAGYPAPVESDIEAVSIFPEFIGPKPEPDMQ